MAYVLQAKESRYISDIVRFLKDCYLSKKKVEISHSDKNIVVIINDPVFWLSVDICTEGYGMAQQLSKRGLECKFLDWDGIENKHELIKKYMIDGYDIGVLATLKRRHNAGYPSYFNSINSGVISEIGWLEEEDLRNRLEKLCKCGYAEHHKDKGEENWSITEKGLELVKHG